MSLGRVLLRRRYAPRVADPVDLWGLHFENRFGLAAGMDKRAEAMKGWAALGLGFVEVGGVTAHAQPGNPKPRMFRLDSHRLLVNRMGFNNDGCEAVAKRIAKVRASNIDLPPLFVNLGKSKITDNADAVDDYAASLRALHHVVDGFVVNVSSPNTPGLRDLQHEHTLSALLASLRHLCSSLDDEVPLPRPLLVKFAPDMEDEELLRLVDVARAAGCDGVVVSNTTVQRPATTSVKASKVLGQAGGLSGAPLAERSTAMIRCVSEHTGGSWPIIGVGGIMSGEDAIEKIHAGAHLVQAYSGFVFEGLGLIRTVTHALAKTRG
jgi:dihydroorotate dehydrogenase